MRPGLTPLIGQPQPVHDAGPEVLNNDIGPGSQFHENGACLGLLEVQRERLLVGILRQKAGPHEPLIECGHVAQLARKISLQRVLDLDHLRAEQRQMERGKRAREDIGQIKHPDTLQQLSVHHVM